MKTEDIRTELNNARKEKNANRVAAFSTLLAAAQTFKGRMGKDPTEQEVNKLIKKEIETLQAQVDCCKPLGRPEFVDFEMQKEVLVALLPPEIPESKYESVVNEAFNAVQPTSVRDIGKVLKFVTEKYGTAVDNGKIAAIVKERLK